MIEEKGRRRKRRERAAAGGERERGGVSVYIKMPFIRTMERNKH